MPKDNELSDKVEAVRGSLLKLMEYCKRGQHDPDQLDAMIDELITSDEVDK